MIDCEKTILVIDPEETVPSGTGEEHLRVTNEANNRTPLPHKYKYTQVQTQTHLHVHTKAHYHKTRCSGPMKQDHLRMNIAPDQTIILGLQLFLDHG